MGSGVDAVVTAPVPMTRSMREQFRAAIASEQRISWIAVAFPLVLWAFVDREPLLLVLSGVFFGLSLVRSRAIPAIDRGDIERAIVLFTASKWLVSLVFVVVLPITLPIAMVNIIMPIALVSTQLQERRFPLMVASAMVVTLLAGMAGYLQNVFELESKVEPWVWQWLCIVVLVAHIVPLSLIVWRSNRQQTIVLDEALDANARLRESDAELRRSRSRLVSAADAERSRIERDLHDGAQQRLVAVLVQLRLAARTARRSGDVDPDGVDALADDLEAGIEEVRRLAHGIYPPLLKMRGLPVALRAVARRNGPRTVVVDDGIGRFDAAIEAALYFCCLEAVQNATKYGGDDVEVMIRLRSTTVDGRQELVATVSDTGPGFDPTGAASAGRGLENVRDRIGAVGGEVAIESVIGGGTTVELTVPVADRPAGTDDGTTEHDIDRGASVAQGGR
ncbi:MAG: histidine kinase [Ilumatobacteraceae bacterium]